MMTEDKSINIVNCMTPGAGVLMLGLGHICHTVKMHNFVDNLSLLPSIDQTIQVCSNDDRG